MKIKTRASPRIDKFWKQLSNKEKWRVPSRVVVFVCFFSTLWKSQNYSLNLNLYSKSSQNADPHNNANHHNSAGFLQILLAQLH